MARSIEKIIPLVAAAVALLGSSIAGGGSLWMMVRDARADVAARSPEYVASTKVYDRAGKLISEIKGPAEARPGFASRLVNEEVACETLPNGTRCVEVSAAPLAAKMRAAFRVIAVCVLVATLAGFAIGMLLARAAVAPLRRMTDVAQRASRENAYSLRVEASRGEAGRAAAAMNDLLGQMQQRDVELRRRSVELEQVNKELESFAYSVSHDLRGPLGSIDGFVQAIETDYGDELDDTAREYFGWIHEGCGQMRDLIDGLLQMTRLTRAEINHEKVDLSAIAESVAESLHQTNPGRAAHFEIRRGVQTVGDERLLRAVLENLMSNAWKFTRHRPETRIEFGQNGSAFYVKDNGAGFDPSHAAKMFRPFQRLHSSREFEGTGIGLATVQKIIERHGGRAWAEGEIDRGATIYFTTGGQDLV
ncbi:MAG TPA: ATP-binding protein, partial [Thermoanaerobaculia bacterium]|nr:ATP-binding protein [Thermoanaerobaculia bacterium]